MGLLQKLKSTLGLGGSGRPRRHDQRGEVDVTVEHEPAAETESAVKGTDDGWESPDDGSGGAEESTEPATEESAAAAESAGGEAAAGADVPVTELSGIGSAYGERLNGAGVESVADLAGADAATLAAETDISEGRLESWIERAGEY